MQTSRLGKRGQRRVSGHSNQKPLFNLDQGDVLRQQKHCYTVFGNGEVIILACFITIQSNSTLLDYKLLCCLEKSLPVSKPFFLSFVDFRFSLIFKSQAIAYLVKWVKRFPMSNRVAVNNQQASRDEQATLHKMEAKTALYAV